MLYYFYKQTNRYIPRMRLGDSILIVETRRNASIFVETYIASMKRELRQVMDIRPREAQTARRPLEAALRRPWSPPPMCTSFFWKFLA
eukprot:SAG31_NODE_37837_length_301_cov_0.752475_1_plen_87_part_10